MEILLDSAYLSFGAHEVLRGATLRISKGSVTGLLGRNGCGKSCLLKIMTGQLTADNVYIGVDGVYLRDLYNSPGLINYLPQHHCHPPSLRMIELMGFYGIDPVTFSGLHGHLFPAQNLRFHELSGGTRRLLEVLLVLEAKTQFTLLDEPFTHIMPLHIEYVQAVVRRRAEEKGILVTDHKFRHVLDLSDTLYLMHSGTTAVITEPEELVRLGYVSSLAH